MRHSSDRLFLHPLQPGEVELFAADDGSLHDLLGLHYAGPCLDDAVKARILMRYELALKAQQHGPYYYLVPWIIVRQDTKEITGALMFKSFPDAEGAVEVGAETYAPYRRQGYMKEAMSLLCSWAQSQSGLHILTAGCDPENL